MLKLTLHDMPETWTLSTKQQYAGGERKKASDYGIL